MLLPEVLLPALCMVPANVGLVNDIWGVLDLIGTTQRWLIYNRLKVGPSLMVQSALSHQYALSIGLSGISGAQGFPYGSSAAATYSYCQAAW